MDLSISENNEVRFIDLFVDSLDICDMGFKIDYVEEGRPAYHPKDLLKLYIYGYLNRIRSSRALEKECQRNIETMWLLKGLVPDHNTISNFRRDNPKAIKKVFSLHYSWNSLCADLNHLNPQSYFYISRVLPALFMEFPLCRFEPSKPAVIFLYFKGFTCITHGIPFVQI